jgi:hypothetical protein
MQAMGGELLRLAACLITERYPEICCTAIHDAFAICAPLAEFDDAITATITAMNEASAEILGGFILRTEVKAFRYPQHYVDDAGIEMCERVLALANKLEGKAA